MKSVKFTRMAAAALVGLASAYASSRRTTFTYVNRRDDGIYDLVGTYNMVYCIFSSVRPCSYVVPINLGPSVYEHTLTLAGGIPSTLKRVYVR